MSITINSFIFFSGLPVNILHYCSMCRYSDSFKGTWKQLACQTSWCSILCSGISTWCVCSSYILGYLYDWQKFDFSCCNGFGYSPMAESPFAYMVCCLCDYRRCLRSTQISKESCRLGSAGHVRCCLPYMDHVDCICGRILGLPISSHHAQFF